MRRFRKLRRRKRHLRWRGGEGIVGRLQNGGLVCRLVRRFLATENQQRAEQDGVHGQNTEYRDANVRFAAAIWQCALGYEWTLRGRWLGLAWLGFHGEDLLGLGVLQKC